MEIPCKCPKSSFDDFPAKAPFVNGISNCHDGLPEGHFQLPPLSPGGRAASMAADEVHHSDGFFLMDISPWMVGDIGISWDFHI